MNGLALLWGICAIGFGLIWLHADPPWRRDLRESEALWRELDCWEARREAHEAAEAARDEER